jgi:hypothetical protein
MAAEKAEHVLRGFAVDLLERLADFSVELDPLSLEQARVRDLLDEPVAEAVLGDGPAALLDHELEPL